MIIEDVIDYTENAKGLAEKIHNQETESDRKEREQLFVTLFYRFIKNVIVIDAMNTIMPINLKDNEFELLKTALQTGQRVYKNQLISGDVPINNIQDAVDLLEKIKNKWKKQYLTSDLVKETISMLELIKPIYKNTPKPKDLIDKIQAVDDDAIDEEIVKTAARSVDAGKDILNNMAIDDDVKSFLKKVSTNTASLMDINENILLWLKNNDLLNKMKITNS